MLALGQHDHEARCDASRDAAHADTLEVEWGMRGEGVHSAGDVKVLDPPSLACNCDSNAIGGPRDRELRQGGGPGVGSAEGEEQRGNTDSGAALAGLAMHDRRVCLVVIQVLLRVPAKRRK